jgi:hypothetical protein
LISAILESSLDLIAEMSLSIPLKVTEICAFSFWHLMAGEI